MVAFIILELGCRCKKLKRLKFRYIGVDKTPFADYKHLRSTSGNKIALGKIPAPITFWW